MLTTLLSLIFTLGFSAQALDAGSYSCTLTPQEKMTSAGKESISGKSALSMNFKYDGADILCSGKILDDDWCEDEGYFVISNPNDDIFFSIPGMYADGNFGDESNGDFIANGDSDGCDTAEFILTKKSGFKSGTIKSRYSCSSAEVNGTYTATVKCSISPL
jgi:hypothetical protein